MKKILLMTLVCVILCSSTVRAEQPAPTTAPKPTNTNYNAPKRVTVEKGFAKKIKLTGATTLPYTYKVKNKKIASVNKNGFVYGKKKGKTTVTVTNTYTNRKKTVKIKVKANMKYLPTLSCRDTVVGKQIVQGHSEYGYTTKKMKAKQKSNRTRNSKFVLVYKQVNHALDQWAKGYLTKAQAMKEIDKVAAYYNGRSRFQNYSVAADGTKNYSELPTGLHLYKKKGDWTKKNAKASSYDIFYKSKEKINGYPICVFGSGYAYMKAFYNKSKNQTIIYCAKI